MEKRSSARLLCTPVVIFTCQFLIFFLPAFSQDYPYPQSPANQSTIFSPSTTLQWKGNDQFSSYSLEVFEADYIPGNNFNSLNLQDYELKYAYEGIAGYEASGLTYHELRGNIFITIDDQASGILFFNNSFTLTDRFEVSALDGWQHEGITYMYNDYFASIEETTNELVFAKFNYTSNNSLSSIQLINKIKLSSANTQNKGNEGITYNPVNNKMYIVKEKDPLAFYELNAPVAPNFNQSVSLTQPFVIENANWAPDDLAGLYHLSLNKEMSATKAGEHILLLSEESSLLLEIDLKGNLISKQEMDIDDLSNVNNDDFFKAEGIAYTKGVIWVASEGNFQTPAVYYGFANNSHQNPNAVIKKSVYKKNNLSSTSHFLEDCILKNNTSYCWKITAKKLDGTTVESTYYNFTTQFQSYGCTDENACNFDECATQPDNSCKYNDCLNICGGNNIPGKNCNDGYSSTVNDYLNDACVCIGKGCTNPNACNYNANAKEDNGSCLEEDCRGFCGGTGIPGTNCNDGFSTTTGDYFNNNCECIGKGCTDINACNYNPNAKEDNGSCLKKDCRGICGGNTNSGSSCTINTFNDGLYNDNCICKLKGCKDPYACNYKPSAVLSDNSCKYMNKSGVCACEPEITHIALNSKYKQSYSAQTDLTSSINIYLAKDITYNAGKSVTLNNGFRVTQNSNLTIQIKNCFPY